MEHQTQGTQHAEEHIVGKIGWKAFRDPFSDHWVATCKSFGLTASGATFNDLVSEISDVMKAMIDELAAEPQDAHEFLLRNGWIPHIEDEAGRDKDQPWELDHIT